MDTRIYSVGKRRRRRKRPSLARLLFVLLAIAVLLLLVLNFELTPQLSAIAEASVRNRLSRTISESVQETIEEYGYHYGDLIDLQYKSDGSISALTANMPVLIELRTKIVLSLLQKIKDTQYTEIKVPLGNLFGFEVLSGRGPDVTVDLLLAEGLSAHMESRFTSAGINQTLHTVLFCISISVDLMLPSKHTQFLLTEGFPVAQTVLLGDVPEAYTEINRLTSDITEEEIDDLNDFGAHVE